MKAVIVDASSSVAVALRDDGQFVKIKNRSFSLGQEITLKSSVARFPKQAAIAASAALVLFAGAGYGVHEWNSPYSYVSLDASPSIEYALNRFDVVIAVNGLNKEGCTVAESISGSVKNTKIDKALEITVAALSDESYISSTDTSNVVVAVYSDNDDKKEELLTTVSNITNTTHENIEVATVAVDKDTMSQIESGKTINEIESVAANAEADASPKKESMVVTDGDDSPAKGTTADATTEANDKVNSTEATASTDIKDAEDNSESKVDKKDDDKQKVSESTPAAIEHKPSKDDSKDKKNDNNSSKEDKKDSTDAKDKTDSAAKDDSPAKTDDSPAKGDVSSPKKTRQMGHAHRREQHYFTIEQVDDVDNSIE